MAYAYAAFLVAAFVVLIKLFGLVERSTEVVALSWRAVAIVRDPALDDDAKEAEMQKSAKRLFVLFFLITIGGMVAAALPAGALWLVGRVTPVSFEAIFDAVESWAFLIAATLVSVAFFWATRKR